jgi:hypothetical protein
MNTKLNTENFLMVLDNVYDRALTGLPGTSSVEELAWDYLQGDGTLTDKVNHLIRYQNVKCATSGFLSGLGGAMTLPVTIPLNISSVLYVQARMIAAVACMGGYDVRNDRVKTLVYVCLCGNEAKDIFKKSGIEVGKKLAETGIKKIPNELIKAINKKVGFRLLTKFGEKGVINLGKLIPVVGGVIGGTCDLVATNTVGNVARNTFITNT